MVDSGDWRQATRTFKVEGDLADAGTAFQCQECAALWCIPCGEAAFANSRTMKLTTVRSDTLELLANRKDDLVLGDVAGNDKTPERALRKMSAHRGETIEWGLA